MRFGRRTTFAALARRRRRGLAATVLRFFDFAFGFFANCHRFPTFLR
jgi:hypothetical protein